MMPLRYANASIFSFFPTQREKSCVTGLYFLPKKGKHRRNSSATPYFSLSVVAAFLHFKVHIEASLSCFLAEFPNLLTLIVSKAQLWNSLSVCFTQSVPPCAPSSGQNPVPNFPILTALSVVCICSSSINAFFPMTQNESSFQYISLDFKVQRECCFYLH